jgi:hypothetical protein
MSRDLIFTWRFITISTEQLLVPGAHGSVILPPFEHVEMSKQIPGLLHYKFRYVRPK